MPQYENDVLKEIADLKRQVQQLAALVQKRGALTTASAGWQLPDRSAPSAPDSGAHIYAASGQARVKQANGTTFAIQPAPTVPQGVAVTSPPVFTSPSNPGSVVDPSEYQALRDDAQAVRGVVINLLNSLRDAGLIAT